LENFSMKKTLIALAAVAAATGAMAQSNVSISGLLEIAPVSNGKVTTQAQGQNVSNSTKTSRTGQQNTYSTSVINFTATEDLGGGLRATAVMISDVDGGFANRERTLALSGDFGAVRMGRFAPTAATGFHALTGASSATLAGSAFGLVNNGATRLGDFAGGSMERQNNVLQYTSPSFGGLVVNVNYGNDSTDRSEADRPGKTQRRQDGLSLTYTAGPLVVAAGMNNLKGQREAVPAAPPVAAVTEQTIKSDLDWVGASYDFGVARLFGSHIKRKDRTTNNLGVQTTNNDAKVNAIGVSVPVDAFTLRAMTYRGKDKRGVTAADDMKLSGYQLSVTYAMSNRTSIIAATGKNDVKRDGGATAATRKETANTLTLNHTF